MVVTFSPAATGVFTDTIVISYTDGVAAQTSNRDLTGTGHTVANLTISDGPGNYDFGTQATTSVTQKTFTVSNSGTATATALADGGTLGGMFAFKGGTYPGTGGTCGASLAGGAT
jgi:hypothetical protein